MSTSHRVNHVRENGDRRRNDNIIARSLPDVKPCLYRHTTSYNLESMPSNETNQSEADRSLELCVPGGISGGARETDTGKLIIQVYRVLGFVGNHVSFGRV